jgi:selenocysteine lyase/cysteine desulfurase
VSFRHPRLKTDAIEERLHSASVICANRMGYIRLSPHYYLTEEEIDRAVDALP